MAEREYCCVDRGRSHVARLWYARQSDPVVGYLLKTDYLGGDAYSHLGRALGAMEAPHIGAPGRRQD
jgi:hypothetical protein